MASQRRNKCKGNDESTDDCAQKALRQSPRKKAMQCLQNETDPLLILAAAAQAGSRMSVDSKTALQEVVPKMEIETPKEITANASPKQEPSSGDDSAEKKKKPQKWTKRALQTQEQISLDVLEALPPKTMADLFSEQLPDANEYETKFSYQCRFFEDHTKCEAVFKGYRDRGQVLRQIERHMVEHRSALIKAGSTSFFTSSIHFRRKQLEMTKKKKVITSSTSKRNGKFTSLKVNTSPLDEVKDEENSNDTESDSSKSSSKKKSSKRTKTVKQPSTKAVPKKQEPENKENTPSTSNRVTASCGRASPSAGQSKKRQRKVVSTSSTDDEVINNITFETSHKLYPFHDHDYCLMPGKKIKGAQRRSNEEYEGLESEDDGSVSSKSSRASASSRNLARGIHLYDEEMAMTPMVCNEETFQEHGLDPKKRSLGKKTPRGKKSSSDASCSSDSDELSEEKRLLRRPAFPRQRTKHIPPAVKAFAMKCIRELKSKKKEEKIEFLCKICPEGRHFTACATLIYHYRSHAGIKPFVCEICGQRFTRMHSKNYHKMIHEDKSRFLCKECGKKFRHPSHYNEHLRKHTGETPFHCDDCTGEFKTRNTYKRHLKTRHGKLLTARGIRLMPYEEFVKVRTKPYKKSNSGSPKHEPVAVPEPAARSSSKSATATATSTPAPTATATKTRKGKGTAQRGANSIKITTAPVPMMQPSMATVSLPPVSTILSPFTHAVSGPPTTLHVSQLPAAIGAVSQASVGMMPSMAVQQGSPGVGMLTMMAPAPTQVAVMGQPVNMGQPTMSLSSIQGPYLTLTAFTPIVPMETTAIYPAAAAPPAQAPAPEVEVAGVSDEDESNYKPVGFITHS